MTTAAAERLIDVVGAKLPAGLAMVPTRERPNRPTRDVPDLDDPATAQAIEAEAVSRIVARGYSVQRAERGQHVHIRVLDELGETLVTVGNTMANLGRLFGELLVDEAMAGPEANPWAADAAEPEPEPEPLVWSDVTVEAP